MSKSIDLAFDNVSEIQKTVEKKDDIKAII